MPDRQEVDRRIRELESAGWAPVNPTIWRAPDGRLFLGPALAWRVMTNEKGPQP